MDIVEDLRKDPYEEERQSPREARIVLGGILERAADEIEQLREENRMYWTRYWDMAQAFERRGNALHRIASMRSDPEFGVPPIMTVQKIAQEALLKEKV